LKNTLEQKVVDGVRLFELRGFFRSAWVDEDALELFFRKVLERKDLIPFYELESLVWVQLADEVDHGFLPESKFGESGSVAADV